MTTEELHPLIDLFLRRAASNPEEMAGGRWRWVLDRIQMHGSQADKDAVQPIHNKVMLDDAHRKMMKELLNPEPEQLGMFSNQALIPVTTPYSGYQNQHAKLHVTGDIEYTGSLRKVLSSLRKVLK